jgi:hypothetical protein
LASDNPEWEETLTGLVVGLALARDTVVTKGRIVDHVVAMLMSGFSPDALQAITHMLGVHELACRRLSLMDANRIQDAQLQKGGKPIDSGVVCLFSRQGDSTSTVKE